MASEVFKLVGRIVYEGGETVTRQITKMEKEAKRAEKVLGSMGSSAEDVMEAIDDIADAAAAAGRPIESMGRSMEKFGGRIPDQYKDINNSLEQTREAIRNTGKQANQSLEEMAAATTKARVSYDKMTSATESGKKAAKIIQDMAEATREAQAAAIGLNKEGTLTLTSEESQDRLRRYNRQLDESRAALEELKEAGDFTSYNAGMQALEEHTRRVQRAMKAAGGGAQEYQSIVQELGIVTSDSANQSVIAMEAHRDAFFRANERMQGMATTTSKFYKAVEQTTAFYQFSKGAINAVDSLEKLAKASDPAALAIEQLGEGASMKDLQDRIMQIEQGLMRIPAVATVAAIAIGGITAALANAAKGPKPADVLKEQERLLAEYTQAVEERTKELVEAWGIFEKVELADPTSTELIDNLRGQVETLKMWDEDLKDIAEQAGVDFANYLRGMGPKAAGEVRTIAEMTKPHLEEYVALWREEMALARKIAEEELEGMRRMTEQKIKELQESLTPLGIAIEDFQQTWITALAPFVESWGRFAAVFVQAGTLIGDFFVKLNEINPLITTFMGHMVYLTTLFTLLLAPLAAGVGFFVGLRAVLAPLIMMAMPLLQGLAAVVPIAAALSAAIIVVVYSFRQMWQQSEALRQAVSSLGQEFLNGIQPFVGPLITAFHNLRNAIGRLFDAMTGGSGKAGGAFQNMGDKLATVVAWIQTNILPYLIQAFQAASNFIYGAITAITPVINNLANVFRRNSDTISAIVNTVFPIIGFIIKTVFVGMVNTITMYLDIILTIFRGGMNVINGIITLFRGIFSGNWSMMWEGIKQIFSGALQLIWGIVQLTLLGRIMAIARKFSGMLGGAFSGMFKGITGGASKFFGWIGRGFAKLGNFIMTPIRSGALAAQLSINTMSGVFRTILNGLFGFVRSVFNNIRLAIITPIQAARGGIQTIVQGIQRSFTGLRDGITGIFKGMKLKLPKISVPPLPHFSLDGEFSLNPPQVPKLSVDWYDKGGIFTGPSIIGVGEKRPEFVGALDDLRQIVREEAGTGAGALTLQIPLYLNGREIARAAAPEIDLALEARRQRDARARGRRV